MKVSPLRLVKRFAEFEPKENARLVPSGRRGLYVLYDLKQLDGHNHYDVVYVGMARSGIRSRLFKHIKSAKKGHLWSHFSVFEVWENITDEEIVELEGLFRHIYRRDSRANALNVQRNFKRATKVRLELKDWK